MSSLLAASKAGPIPVEVKKSQMVAQPELWHIAVGGGKVNLNVVWPATEKDEWIELAEADLTAAQQRLLARIMTSLDRMAWDDLRTTLGAPALDRPRIFISYRSGHDKFAEALAQRMGEEGFVPWFDKWDVLAGDSIPGKIDEAFRESEAFIPILTADYQEGRWATDELLTAVTKRIEEGYRIVPVVLEKCEKPELIKHLRHVDFTAHDPETYESKVAELIDGIYGLEVNPFRA